MGTTKIVGELSDLGEFMRKVYLFADEKKLFCSVSDVLLTGDKFCLVDSQDTIRYFVTDIVPMYEIKNLSELLFFLQDEDPESYRVLSPYALRGSWVYARAITRKIGSILLANDQFDSISWSKNQLQVRKGWTTFEVGPKECWRLFGGKYYTS
jgi:hypothetical protein